jgi:hypothetical protein
MDRFEAEITARQGAAQKALDGLAAAAGGPGAAKVAEARGALERFSAQLREVLRLSRRNSNVRSLAVALRQKPALSAACDTTLAELRDALARAQMGPTR